MGNNFGRAFPSAGAEPRVLCGGLVYGEGPRWRGGRLVVSDVGADKILAVARDGTVTTLHKVHGPSGTVPLADGRLLVSCLGGGTANTIVAVPPGSAKPLEGVYDYPVGSCNDACADGLGGAYVGGSSFDVCALESVPALEKRRLYRNLAKVPLMRVRTDEPGGKLVCEPCTPAELVAPNGISVTPDGKTVIVCETQAARLAAYDRAEDGTLSNYRVWAPLPGCYPDGHCQDAEGCVWVASPYLEPDQRVTSTFRYFMQLAHNGGLSSSLTGPAPRTISAFVRVAPGGKVLDAVVLRDGWHAIACVLGGDDGKTLFLVEAWDIDPARHKGEAGNSRIRTVRVAVGAATRPDPTQEYHAGL